MATQSHPHDDDAAMYCLHCGDVVRTNYHDHDEYLAECVRCESVDLLHTWDAEDQGLIAL
jgi:hypothetical protein